MQEYCLNEDDQLEIIHLQELLDSRRKDMSEADYQLRAASLEGIFSGKIERTGVDTQINIKAGKLGILEREKGRYKSGRIFFFNRAFRSDGRVFNLEDLFNLREPSSSYAYREEQKFITPIYS